MSDDAEKKEDDAAAAAPKKKSKLPLIIGLVVLLVAGGGGAAVMMMGGEKKQEGEEAPVEKEPVLRTIKLDPFIVNLSDHVSFLKTTLVIEYDLNVFEAAAKLKEAEGSAGGGHGAGGGGDTGPTAPPQFKEREPMVRDAVLRVLSSKHKEDLLQVKGKEQLRDELIEALNEALGLEESAIVAIYFLEFIIQ